MVLAQPQGTKLWLHVPLYILSQDLLNLPLNLFVANFRVSSDPSDLTIPVGAPLSQQVLTSHLNIDLKSSSVPAISPQYRSNMPRSFVVQRIGKLPSFFELHSNEFRETSSVRYGLPQFSSLLSSKNMNYLLTTFCSDGILRSLVNRRKWIASPPNLILIFVLYSFLKCGSIFHWMTKQIPQEDRFCQIIAEKNLRKFV